MSKILHCRLPSRVGIGILVFALSACASRPGPDVLTAISTTAPGAKSVTVYAATTRSRQAPGANVFTDGRAPELNYARFKISIPPNHQVSQIEWPTGKPDPAKDFVVSEQALLTSTDFAQDVKQDVGAVPTPHKVVAVFVHGYNYNFQESLFRMAQMAADSGIDSVPVLFAWPSQGAVTGYVADRDAVTYSRDYLASLLVSLAQDKNADEILLFGHSLGSFLIMEAVRQLKLEGRSDVIARLRVVLASPDIDADVFRTQLDVIGKMTPPLTVLVSSDDRALYISSMLDGDHPRVGRLDINDPKIRKAALDHGVQVVDITSLKASDSFNHDRYANLAQFYPQLASLNANQGVTSAGQVGAFVLDAAGATISSPFKLASQIVNPQ